MSCEFGDLMKNFIDKLSDEDKKIYLNGLIEKIVAMYLPEINEHQLTIHFNLPIVKDGIRWRDSKNKSMGYALLKGAKKLMSGSKKRSPMEQTSDPRSELERYSGIIFKHRHET